MTNPPSRIEDEADQAPRSTRNSPPDAPRPEGDAGKPVPAQSRPPLVALINGTIISCIAVFLLLTPLATRVDSTDVLINSVAGVVLLLAGLALVGFGLRQRRRRRRLKESDSPWA